jgi:hypothetical protein
VGSGRRGDSMKMCRITALCSMATTLALATGASALVCLTIFPPAQTRSSQWWFAMVAARGPQLWLMPQERQLAALAVPRRCTCASSLSGFWRTTARRLRHLRPMTSDGDDGTSDKKPTASSVNRPQARCCCAGRATKPDLGRAENDYATSITPSTIGVAAPIPR